MKAHLWEDRDDQVKWKEFLDAMESGEIVEIDEGLFYYWLEVLPPAKRSYIAKLPNGKEQHAWFGFAEGEDNITAFWRSEQGVIPERFFCCQTEEINKPW